MSKLIENMQSYQSGTDKEFLLILVLFKLNGLNFALLRKKWFERKGNHEIFISFHKNCGIFHKVQYELGTLNIW